MSDLNVEPQQKDSELLPVPKPGDGLKEARLKQNLSLEEVAKSLNLLKDLIESIENNTAAEKISLAYARGYTLNYARLVKLDLDQVAAQFDHHFGSTKQYLENRGHQQQSEKNHAYLAWLMYLLLLGLLVAGLWYFLPTRSEPVSPQSEANAIGSTDPITIDSTLDSIPIGLPPDTSKIRSSTANNNGGALAANRLSDQAPRAPTGGQPSQNNGANDNTITTVTASSQQEGVGEGALVAMESGGAQRQTPDSENASQPEDNLLAIDSEPVNNGVEESLPEATDQLLIEIMAPTWIKVTDADQKVIYAALRNNLGELKLEGQAPFEIILGNAPGARVEFNGERIEVASYTSRQTNYAKFTVGR